MNDFKLEVTVALFWGYFTPGTYISADGINFDRSSNSSCYEYTDKHVPECDSDGVQPSWWTSIPESLDLLCGDQSTVVTNAS